MLDLSLPETMFDLSNEEFRALDKQLTAIIDRGDPAEVLEALGMIAEKLSDEGIDQGAWAD